MINISFGIVLGVMGTLFAIYVAVILFEKTATKQKPQGRTAAQKLGEARRYLVLIANRTSILEARKIANKAIKETQ